MIVNIQTREIISVAQMYADNPQTCPTIPVAPFDGYAFLDRDTVPAYDRYTQRLVKRPLAVLIGDEWTAEYEVQELPPEQAADNLGTLKAQALARVDADTDGIYAAVIGNKQSEYEATERQAVEFAAAGFEGQAGELVHCWAEIKGWTDQQAAEDIISESATWRQAQASIRVARLTAKEQIRAATGSTAALAAIADWSAFRAAILAQLTGSA